MLHSTRSNVTRTSSELFHHADKQREPKCPIDIQCIRHTALHLDDIGSGSDIISGVTQSESRTDPFSQYSMIPLPSPFGVNVLDSTCFRRRNERERERVRCVNDGYVRLKEHLPVGNKHKRLSKVETLRCAIDYIKYLKCILHSDSNNGSTLPNRDGVETILKCEASDNDQCTHGYGFDCNRSYSNMTPYGQCDDGNRNDNNESDYEYDVFNTSSELSDNSLSDVENIHS